MSGARLSKYFLAALVAALAPAYAAAQHQSRPRIPKNVTPEMIGKVKEALGKKLKLDPNGVEIQRIFGRAPRPEKTWTDGMQVVKHLRGKNGIRYPEKQDLAMKVDLGKFVPLIKERLEERNKQAAEFPKTLFPPTACAESRTKKERMQRIEGDKPNKEQANQVFLDMLFIAKDDLPPTLDMDEAFGKQTVVRRIDTSKPQLAGFAMQSAGATCLPYRYRVTRTHRMTDEGLNAVMNYGDKPHGKGKLAPALEHLRNRYP